MAVEQHPALALPLHGVGERETLGVAADRDQLVGAALRGVDAVDRTPAQRMPARRLAGASLGNGMVSAWRRL